MLGRDGFKGEEAEKTLREMKEVNTLAQAEEQSEGRMLGSRLAFVRGAVVFKGQAGSLACLVTYCLKTTMLLTLLPHRQARLQVRARGYPHDFAPCEAEEPSRYAHLVRFVSICILFIGIHTLCEHVYIVYWHSYAV